MSVKGTINLLSIPYLRASFVIDFSLALLTISRLYSPYPSVLIGVLLPSVARIRSPHCLLTHFT